MSHSRKIAFFIVLWLNLPAGLFAQTEQHPDLLFRELSRCASSIDSLHILLKISDAVSVSDPEYCLEVTDFTQQLALRIGDTKSLIQSSNRLAAVQKELGFMNLARKTIGDNITRAENKGDKDLIGQTRLIAGHVKMASADFSGAKTDYQTALRYFSDMRDSAGMAYAYEGIGTVHNELGADDQAMSFYEKAENCWSKDDHYGKADLWTDMGVSYTHLGQFEEAGKFLNKALAYYQKQGDFSGQVAVNYDIGVLNMKQKNYFEAEAAFINCQEIGKQRNNPQDILLAYKGLYELDKSEAKWQQALIYYEKYVALEREIVNHSGEVSEGLKKYYIADANLATMNTQEGFYQEKFESAHSERQMLWVVVLVGAGFLAVVVFFVIKFRIKNRKLQEQKRDIESKNDEIDVSLREKDLLLKEVHHRVKNNLQIISSLLNLQRHRVDDEETLKALSESINRIQSISLIHQKFYQSTNLAKVDFKNYLTDLVESQKRLYADPHRPVRTAVIGKTHFLGLDTAVPLGLIIAELITNSFKHAFHVQLNPELTIRIETDDYLTLTVKDNGMGLPQGFSIKNSKSLGMEIVEALSEQLYGNVSYRNEAGAMFIVRVKEVNPLLN